MSALAAFLECRPKEPTSRYEDDWDRYKAKCAAFDVAVKVIQGYKLTVHDRVDHDQLQRYLNKYARIEERIIAQAQLNLFDRGGGR